MDSEGRATQEAKAENRSLQGVNEDSRTELMYRTYCMLALQEQKPLTPLSRKKCIFRGALKLIIALVDMETVISATGYTYILFSTHSTTKKQK